MAWVYLIIAGVLEIVWAVAMKQSDGLTRLGHVAIMVVAMIGSVTLLALAMRSLPLGTAYMIWTGIGALGAFAVGILFLGEGLTMPRLLAGLLITAGMVLMKLSATE